MIRTQIQIPDEIYEKAKEFCRRKELSLAELCRRSLEEYLLHWGGTVDSDREWLFPVLPLGDFIAPPAEWRRLANELEERSD